jgi:hypothetical protein
MRKNYFSLTNSHNIFYSRYRNLEAKTSNNSFKHPVQAGFKPKTLSSDHLSVSILIFLFHR